MHKLGKSVIAALCTTAFLAACADGPVSTQGADELALFKADNPNRAYVVVYEMPYSFVLRGVDLDRRLTSLHGMGVEDPAESEFCTGNPVSDVMTFHDVNKWLDENADDPRVRRWIRGEDVWHHVYDLDEYGGANVCDRVQTPRVAQGTGSFKFTDNDYGADGPGIDSFGWVARGTLDDLVNGGTVRYHEVQRGQFDTELGVYKKFTARFIRLTKTKQ